MQSVQTISLTSFSVIDILVYIDVLIRFFSTQLVYCSRGGSTIFMGGGAQKITRAQRK